MHHDQHEAANQQVYATAVGVDQLDHPLVLKVDAHSVPVFAADDVAPDTLGLPEADLTATQSISRRH